MNIIKISAVLTAALLTGALSATAFAAETLTTTTGSITFRKAIDVTNATGAGGITGTIAFDVTAADESDLPDDGERRRKKLCRQCGSAGRQRHHRHVCGG